MNAAFDDRARTAPPEDCPEPDHYQTTKAEYRALAAILQVRPASNYMHADGRNIVGDALAECPTTDKFIAETMFEAYNIGCEPDALEIGRRVVEVVKEYALNVADNTGELARALGEVMQPVEWEE